MTSSPQHHQDPSGPFGDQQASAAQQGAPMDGGPGQGAPGRAPYKKSIAAVIFGILFLLVAGLFTLGALAQAATGNMGLTGNTAYDLGQFIGAFLVIILPAALGIFLLTVNRRRRRRAEAQQRQAPHGHPGYEGYSGHPTA